MGKIGRKEGRREGGGGCRRRGRRRSTLENAALRSLTHSPHAAYTYINFYPNDPQQTPFNNTSQQHPLTYLGQDRNEGTNNLLTYLGQDRKEGTDRFRVVLVLQRLDLGAEALHDVGIVFVRVVLHTLHH